MVRDADSVGASGAARRRDLRRRLHARGGGRLPRRAQPRAADGRDGALRLAARRVRLRQAHVAPALGRGGAARRTRTTSCALADVEGLARPRARRGREAAKMSERSEARCLGSVPASADELEGSGAAAAAGAPAVRRAGAPQRHQARRQRVALSAVARGDGGDGARPGGRSSCTAIPTPAALELRQRAGGARSASPSRS